MSSRMRARIRAAGSALLAVWIVGCAAPTAIPTSTDITTIPAPTATPTQRATPTSIPTTTISPSSTPLPLPPPTVYTGELPENAYAVLGIGRIITAALSPDHSLLAVLTNTGMGVYHAQTLEPIWLKMVKAETLDDPIEIKWSPDGSKIAISAYRDVIVLNAHYGQELLRLNRLAMNLGVYGNWASVAWLPDGESVVASELFIDEVYVANVNTREYHIASKLDSELQGLNWSSRENAAVIPDSQPPILRADNAIVLQHPGGAQSDNYLVGSTGQYGTLVWSDDGEAIILLDSDARTVKPGAIVSAWDVQSASQITEITSALSAQFDLAAVENSTGDISPDGTRRIDWENVEIARKRVNLRSAETDELIEGMYLKQQIGEVSRSYTAWSSDSRFLACTMENTLYVWSAETGRLILQIDGYPFGGARPTFSPDQSLIATLVGSAIVIWKVP